MLFNICLSPLYQSKKTLPLMGRVYVMSITHYLIVGVKAHYIERTKASHNRMETEGTRQGVLFIKARLQQKANKPRCYLYKV